MRRIGVVLAAVLVLLLLGLAGGWLYLRGSLPKTGGTVTVAGLDGPVEIVRDKHGVPHIFASTDHDAVFGMGYVHAQDRLWQMEMNRRVGAGRLSEVLGDAALDTDKFLRTLGPYRAAASAWDALSPDARQFIEAYVAGVNAWLAEGHTLPPEFLILGFKPEPWTPLDSVVWATMMAWDLAGDYDMELLRMRLTQAVGPERTAQLLPAYPDEAVNILAAAPLAPSAADSLLRLDTAIKGLLGLRGLNVGSNNWVVAGSRSETGMPLLANDPHLGARIPSVWYLAELQGDSLHVTGASFPSLPFFPIGHNERIAWGVTNVDPDVQDLYVERINPANPNQYEVEGEWVNMEIVEEPIVVDGEDQPLRWAARSTRHGPLISDVQTTGAPVALRWTALDPGDTTIDAYLAVNYAANWDEFTAALRLYVGPSQNFVYADVEGNIGYFAPGHIPIRAQGDGMLPAPGWDSEYEWTGWIPFEELPQVYNPPAGYVVTANNRIVDDTYPHLISNDWSPPFRAERIVALIEQFSAGGETISADEMALIQNDQVSAQAAALLPYLLEVAPTDERQTQALDLLRGWDGHIARDSAAAAIYEAWFLALGKELFADELRGDLYVEMAERTHDLFVYDVAANQETMAVWCDDVLTAPTEDCAAIAQRALDVALDDLEERLGARMARWQWGDVHRTQYPHMPFSDVDSLRPLFHRSIANGGDPYTVNVAGFDMASLYDQDHVPSYRQIVDLADWGASRFIHTTGQSGDVLSRHYDDLIEPHRDGVYLPMTFGREQVQGDLLRLEPGGR